MNPEPQVGDRRISKFWDCSLAAYRYRLQLRCQTPHGMHHYWNTIATGTEEWANRNAAYFGIDVIREELFD